MENASHRQMRTVTQESHELFKRCCMPPEDRSKDTVLGIGTGIAVQMDEGNCTSLKANDVVLTLLQSKNQH